MAIAADTQAWMGTRLQPPPEPPVKEGENGEDASKLTFEQIVTHPTMSVRDKNLLIMMYHKDRMDEWIQYGLGGTHPSEMPFEPPISPITGKPVIPTLRAGEPPVSPTGVSPAGVAETIWQEVITGVEEGEPTVPTEMKPAVRWDVIIDEDTGYRVQVGYDEDGNIISYEPIGAPPTEPTRYGAPGEVPTDPFGRAATWNERLGSWDYPPEWGQPEAGWVSPFEEEEAARRAQEAQQRIAIEQQQAQQQAEYYAWQQEEARRQYGAQLAAQPQSWLQYAAYTGEQPAIQPWMQPLMPQQYEQLGAGAAIPGWQAPQAGIMGGAPAQGMAGLPELTRPSRQYQARMGPTAMQQYGGYQQARTGVRPEELQWRLWSGAPPGGQYQGLRYTR